MKERLKLKGNSLTNIANYLHVCANPHGMMHSSWKGSKEYNGPVCQSKMFDQGQDRVALEAMNGTGFLTVAGNGLAVFYN